MIDDLIANLQAALATVILSAGLYMVWLVSVEKRTKDQHLLGAGGFIWLAWGLYLVLQVLS